MSGGLEKMIITAYSDQNFKSQVGAPLSVWINPASYIYTYSVLYNDRQAQGAEGPSPDFNRMGPDSVSFDLVFDATGVVPSPIAGKPDAPADGVVGMIARFKTLALYVNSSTHSPNFIKLSWAQLQFQCRLQNLTITYTLFRPDGTPLRAKLAVSFLGFTSEQQLAQESALASPDMTHIVTVVAGDSLPTLCYRIYGSSLYYLRVAELNKLNTFRRLEPGTQLMFPPLTGSS